MAFPASQPTLKTGLENLQGVATRTKKYVMDVRNASAVGPVNRWGVLSLARTITEAIAVFDATSALTGIGPYAQDQLGNATLNVATEFSNMRAAAVSLRDWIVTNFPRDAGTGAVLVYTVAADGTLSDLTFTSAQLASFRTQADAFAATIS